MAHSYYEESFKLHSENARLRNRIESLEQGLEIDKLRRFYESEITKHVNKEKSCKSNATGSTSYGSLPLKNSVQKVM